MLNIKQFYYYFRKLKHMNVIYKIKRKKKIDKKYLLFNLFL